MGVLVVAAVAVLLGDLPLAAAEEAPPTAEVELVDPGPVPSEPPVPVEPEIPEGDFSRMPGVDGQLPELDGGPSPETFDEAGRSVVERSETTTTYDNGDGTSTMVVHSSPVNFEDEGGVWRPIDTALAPSGSAFRARSGRIRPGFPNASRSGALVDVDGPGWSLGFRLAGVQAGKPARVSGSQLRYDDVLPNGVSLRAKVTSVGVKEELILARRLPKNVTPSYRFPLELDGVEARVDEGGVIGFYGGDGVRVAFIPPGVAHDSSGSVVAGRDPASAPVKIELVEGRDGPAVEVSVDRAWLDDPARVYPVFVDPSLEYEPGVESGHWDAFVSSACPGCNYNGLAQVDGGAYVNKIGKKSGAEYSTYMRFEMDRLNGHVITQASWNGMFDSVSAVPNQYTMWRAAGPWDDFGITWANRPGHLPGGLLAQVDPNVGQVEEDITGVYKGLCERGVHHGGRPGR